MIALVTDSSSQIPESLRDRYDVRVVPITVIVDGHEHHEGVDLQAPEFYARLGRGAIVSTAAPAPGEVLDVYRQAADAGASEVLSVHIGSNTSATVNAAKLAADASPIPVEIVDTGTASFAVACCVWGAAEALAAGASLTRAAEVARAIAGQVGNVFIMGGLELARRGGRLAETADAGDGVPVLALADGRITVIGTARDDEDAVAAMTDYVVEAAAGRPQRVGVGDALVADLADEYEARLRERPEVVELVRYEVGPSVGAHTGPGTVGACFFPASS